ncbi:MAG: hypothetical protein Q8L51_01505 [Candidatus Amesbacteria bacterium]|nr:hypothetical protein [Candidatus Amesbacteria bacterium]
MIYIILAILPILVLFGPVLWLIKSEKRFDMKFGAISDLNNFKSSKTLYTLFLGLWEISQYIFILVTFNNLLNYPIIIFCLFILVISLVTLPISSHKKEHILPQIVSCLVAILITIYITLSIQKYVVLLIDLLMTILVGVIAFSIHKKKKIGYWKVEMLIGALIGIWNLLILS